MPSLNLFSGSSSATNVVPESASGIFPTSILNGTPAEDFQTRGLLSGATGVLSQTSGVLSGVLDLPTPKPPIVWDASFNQLNFAILLRLLSFVGLFIPPVVRSLLLLCIPPFVSFYELTLRKIFPRLPSVFTIVLKLYKNGVLTMGTVTWLVSSLPQSMTSGLSAVGGIAMGGTTALAGGATAFMGGAAAAASAVAGVAGQAASVATGGLNGATNLVDGAAKGIADGISLIQTGEMEVAQNVARLMERGTATDGGLPIIGNTSAVAAEAIQAAAKETTNMITAAAIQSVANPVAAVGTATAAVTENATKLTRALDGINPLSNLVPKESNNAQEQDQQGVIGNLPRPKLPGFT